MQTSCFILINHGLKLFAHCEREEKQKEKIVFGFDCVLFSFHMCGQFKTHLSLLRREKTFHVNPHYLTVPGIALRSTVNTYKRAASRARS